MSPLVDLPLVRTWAAPYRRRATRCTDHRPASSNAAPMNSALRLETAGAGFAVAHTPPLQSALAHWRLSLHEALSGRLWGVGVAVAVSVVVGVFVAVAVGVLVAVPMGVLVAVGVGVAVLVAVGVCITWSG